MKYIKSVRGHIVFRNVSERPQIVHEPEPDRTEPPKSLRTARKEKDKAYRLAIKLYPTSGKPEKCEGCGKNEPVHRHHVVKIRLLYKIGRHLDPKAHLCKWLCDRCHSIIHCRTIPKV